MRNVFEKPVVPQERERHPVKYFLVYFIKIGKLVRARAKCQPVYLRQKRPHNVMFGVYHKKRHLLLLKRAGEGSKVVFELLGARANNKNKRVARICVDLVHQLLRLRATADQSRLHPRGRAREPRIKAKSPEKYPNKRDCQIYREGRLGGNARLRNKKEKERGEYNIEKLRAQNGRPQLTLESDDLLAVEPRHIKNKCPQQEEYCKGFDVESYELLRGASVAQKQG